MTAPLTPPDCDLRGMAFMPLDVMRLRDSDLALRSTGDEFKAAVILWCASWLQIPAASLPADDLALRKLAGVEEKPWKKIRDGALRGWSLCSDGRLYHSVVAEKALEAWDRRGEWEEKQDNKTTRQQRWRERCKALSGQLRETGVAVPAGASLTVLEEMVSRLTVDGHVDVLASTGASTVDVGEMPLTGTETGTVDSVPNGTGGPPPDTAIAELLDLPINVRSWRLAKRALMDRGGMTAKAAGDLVAKWVNKDKLRVEDLWDIAVATWEHGTDAPADYMGGAVRRALAKDSTVTGVIAPPPERQRAWMAEFREKPNSWKPGDRGPRPGAEGCRVDAAIQREFGVEPFGAVLPFNQDRRAS